MSRPAVLILSTALLTAMLACTSSSAQRAPAPILALQPPATLAPTAGPTAAPAPTTAPAPATMAPAPAVPAPTPPPAVAASDPSNTRCVSLPPTGTARGQTIFVDPGHGGLDPGAVGTTSDGSSVSEKDATLGVGLALAPLLRADGFNVVMSRTTDTTVAQLDPGDQAGGALTVQGVYHDLKARIDCADAANATFLLAIHFDAAERMVRGAETVYDSARPFEPDNQHLAQLVQQNVVSSLAAGGWTVPDRGIIDDSALGGPALSAAGAAYGRLMELGPPQAGYLDRASAMPGALVEALFITNPAEADVAVSSEGQKAIANGLDQAMLTYANQE
jgi:N-acetylmuramoyl-L-alanine amidase